MRLQLGMQRRGCGEQCSATCGPGGTLEPAASGPAPTPLTCGGLGRRAALALAAARALAAAACACLRLLVLLLLI